MTSKKWAALAVFIVISLQCLYAQYKTNIEFGKIGAGDFKYTASTFDSGANAVIIADVGKTSFEGNNKGWFTLRYTRFMRVKIINKNGYGIADNRILLYHNLEGLAEKLMNLKASTYNLENGKISEIKLDSKSVFDEKYNKHYDLKKFTMPAMKEGSIYDLEYTIKSDFVFELRSWDFQGNYPCLWSEYQVRVPTFFHYVMELKGYNLFDINTNKAVFESFAVRENGLSSGDVFNVSCNSIEQRWVKKNIPALKQEPYITSLDNYKMAVRFQLNYVQFDAESQRQSYLDSWPTACQKLMDDDDFGKPLKDNNHWMNAEMSAITEGAKTEMEKSYRIYSYVRDNFSCAGHKGIYIQSTLKDVFARKSGNAAEINLVLVAMLRHDNIDAFPVILSTRENGIANETHPLIDEYNHVICLLRNGSKDIKLDASYPFNGFGNLRAECYDGIARMVDAQKPHMVILSPDSIYESSMTQVTIENSAGGKYTGSLNSTLGIEKSYELREEIKSSSEQKYLKNLETQKAGVANIENFGIDSLNSYDDPVSIHYNVDFTNMHSQDFIYFTPMLGEIYKNNPFISANRQLPVELQHKVSKVYLLTMDIPKGYAVEEMPKSADIVMRNDAIFEYRIELDGNTIQMRTTLHIRTTHYDTEDYNTLREFFSNVIKKENEQIIFKRIKF